MAVRQVQDAVSKGTTGRSVRDQQDGTVSESVFAEGEKFFLPRPVKHRGGLIENQNRRIFDRRPCQRNALLLPTPPKA